MAKLAFTCQKSIPATLLNVAKRQAQKLKVASADSMGYVTAISCMKKTRQHKDFLKKATFEEINFRKNTFGGIYL